MLTENQMNHLAQTNPKELIRILSSPNTDIHTLTFGAEILGGEQIDESLVLPVFIKLLKHINAVVREGAIIGLSSFYFGKKMPADLLGKLKTISLHDPSPLLKEVAKTTLEEFNE